jgi:type II secretory pathway component PulK
MRSQQGATLVVTLVMLLMLMLMVGSSYTLSGTNLKAVGNMQFRNEAIASANIGIERVLGSAFTTAPTAEQLNVDINNDGTTDYQVSMAAPICLSAKQSAGSSLCGNGTLPMCSQDWNTVWELNATVTDAVTGTAVKVRSGVRVQLTDTQKRTVCGA